MGSILERVARRSLRADEMTPVEWESYKKQHPDADRSKHKIVKPGEKGKAKEEAAAKGKAKEDATGKAPGGKPKPPPAAGTSAKPPESAKKPRENQILPPPIPEEAKQQTKPHHQQRDEKPAGKSNGKSKGHSGWKRLQGLKDSAAEYIQNAPKVLQHFIGDPQFRKATLKEAKEGIVAMPKKAKHRLVETIKEEVHEFKSAARGISSVISGKKMSKHEKSAFRAVAMHLSIGAAAAAFAATGPIMAAAVFSKNLVTHVALKSVRKALGSLHTANEVNHIGHGVFHFFDHIASSQIPDGSPAQKADPEEVMVNLILAAVAKTIVQLNDDDFTQVLNHLGKDEGEDEDDDGDLDDAEPAESAVPAQQPGEPKEAAPQEQPQQSSTPPADSVDIDKLAALKVLQRFRTSP